ncbi:aldo/keto reductase [Serratia proteamaculans]|uniref:Aldo/keto reductase n=1 Tax=Serratia proteamaculans TaxID=28151 RepID=A0A7U0NBD2_SERPR|nr:aldo/keto reductase [Serratia proteamaculans]MBO1504490.1 aldo/keto reductase [Serratia proteamaculans]MDW5512565.1 aldo/keto reductase [Serratia proteamaculans]QQX55898.1 aldo/keto reductase [Serratia proteamaculans]
MNYVRLGNSGLKVSQLCLGCMTYGDPGWRPWVLPEDQARPFIREALEAGINFFDTANIYSSGESERILGRALKDFAHRDDMVIATKAFFPMGEQPNNRGLSRKHIIQSVEASLQRLGTDYLDLFVMHRFDEETPIEETAETLDALVRAGKIRYLGASSMQAWHFMKMLAFQRHNKLAAFISMQSQYNLVTREDEEDLIPLCLKEGVSLTPWSPLARGLLAGAKGAGTLRAETDEQAPRWYGDRKEVEQSIMAVENIAAERGVPAAQVSLAWVLAKTVVAAPIVGMSKSHHLQDALKALSLTLSHEKIAQLEAPMKEQTRLQRW